MISKVKYNICHSVCMVSAIILFAGCFWGAVHKNTSEGQASEIENTINGLVKQYELDIVPWEVNNSLNTAGRGSSALEGNIRAVIKDAGIPEIPGILIRTTTPPLLLVISPRDKILYFKRFLLIPEISDSQVENLEKQFHDANLSANVSDLAGFGGAYPAIVSGNLESREMLDVAVEEWVHQHLSFRPLGFLYLLDSVGVSQSPMVISMNETLAGMIADELGAEVYNKFYKGKDTDRQTAKAIPNFDFNAEMHLTRVNTDLLLSAEMIDRAEQYMEERRIYINSHGYKIRKLNQAYFAFHGIYGKDPSAVTNMYDLMKNIRGSFDRLADFITEISGMTTYEQLVKASEKLPK
jgi:hypothetical protein